MQTYTDVAVLRDGLTCPGGPERAGGAASSARSRESLTDRCVWGPQWCQHPPYFGRSFHKAAFTGSPPGLWKMVSAFGERVSPCQVCGHALYWIYFRQCLLLVLIKIHFQAFVGLA